MPNYRNLKEKITLAWLSVDKLLIDSNVNRPEVEAWKRRMTRDFDYRLLGGIVVNRRRDGTYVILEGQHRRLAAQELGIPELPCVIISLGSTALEAEVIAKTNSERKRFSALTEFRNLLLAKKEPEVSIAAILKDAGLHVANHDTGSAIQAVRSLRRIYQRGQLRHVATLATMAWELSEPNAKNGWLWEGLAHFLDAYDKLVDEDKLVEQLSLIGAETVLRRAHGAKERLGGVSNNVAIAYTILDVYNHRRKTGRLERVVLTDYYDPSNRVARGEALKKGERQEG